MTTRIRLPPVSLSIRITGAHQFYVQLERATGVCHPLIRRQNLQTSTMGHGKVQRIQGTEEVLHPLGIFFCQFAPPHFLRQRRV